MNRERETEGQREGDRGTEGGQRDRVGAEGQREGGWRNRGQRDGHRGTEKGDRRAERKGIQELWAVSWACPSWDSR